MEKERSQELQQNLAGEALAKIARKGGEANVVKHEQAIKFIGAACGIPEESTSKLLDTIRQGKETPDKARTSDALPETIRANMGNWSAQDMFWMVMDLFQAAIIMTAEEGRTTMYHMAEELADTPNFDKWLNGNQ